MVKKLVFGVGINDADYVQQVKEELGRVNGKRKQRVVWVCPFYRVWLNMLSRCYNNSKEVNPTYADCIVCCEWLTFSNFKAWMEVQDWKSNCLDKDILLQNNKIYGPETCVFVTQETNKFIVASEKQRGEWPIGACYDKSNCKFISKISRNKKVEHLGLFETPEAAHKAWLAAKLELAYILASKQTDERVAKALIDRYENYKEYFG